MTLEDKDNKEEFTLENHIRECDMADSSSPQAVAQHEARFGYTAKFIEARLARNLTIKDLAKALGTTQSRVAQLESGRIAPNINFLQRLAGILDVEICIGPEKLDIKPIIHFISRPLGPHSK